jgi:peptide/nickel transport system permease protein
MSNANPIQSEIPPNFTPNLGKKAGQRFYQDKMAVLGAIALTIILLCVIFGPIFYTTTIDEIDFSRSSMGPTWNHPFGTNSLGQDILARMLSGGRISIAVGVAAMLVAITVGVFIGAVSGYYGGIIDALLMRLTDLFLALPQLPLLLLVVYLFRDPIRTVAGPELGIFILVVWVIGSLTWMSVARLVRAGFLTVKQLEFVSAARALGASPRRIIWIHILPNIIGPVIVAATLAIGNAIITESTLSFFGLGFPPDVPTWGRMLYDARDYLQTSPHQAIFPGLAIFITVSSINYIGDGLRDALDPQSSATKSS